MFEVELKQNKMDSINTAQKSNAANPIKPVYKEIKHYLNKEKFIAEYEDAIELLCGDKLLKPLDSMANATIRKTSTKGVYKVITNDKIKILDESQLVNNEQYCKGAISKLSNGEYEIMYYDKQRNVEILHLKLNETIEFLNEHNLIL